MTVAELADRIDSRELTEWAAFERVEGPIGQERADGHAGIVASIVANSNRKKGRRAFEPNDFIPDWEKLGIKEEETISLDPTAQREAMFRALGGKGKMEDAPRAQLLDAKGNPIPPSTPADGAN